MRNIRFTILLFLILGSTTVLAQLDSIQQLDEVLLIDAKLTKYSEGYDLKSISDTIVDRSGVSLTDVLRLNSSIYFKENGYGMVSSPSFRGTNASQTAVIWNGIPINSNLNGQTDFNLIVPQSSEEITIRSGGGSVQYGSGAIGGSIHLNNAIQFNKGNKSEVDLAYGSYNTSQFNFETKTSNDRFYNSVNVSVVDSKNDYKYIGKDLKNDNGEFLKFNAAYNFGYRWGNNLITFHSNYFNGDRNFSSSITATSNNNYKDVTSRNLLSWKVHSNDFISNLKVAHLFERYRYFPDKNDFFYTEGKANTFIGDYSFEYFILNDFKLQATANFTRIEGDGTNIGLNYRNTLSAVVLLSHQVTEKLSYGMNVRQEFLNDFDNPFLIAVDGKYQVNSWYAIKANASKNYRVPTFNDLYWNAGGNLELEPETSLQAELGNEFIFSNVNFNINGFYIASKDLISWRPNDNGLWSPINVKETTNYGIEASSDFSKKLNNHILKLTLNYAYTKAIDEEKNSQLIYVPYHKATGNFSYQYKNISTYYQVLYNGEVFTTTDNIGIVDDYVVNNLGIEYQLVTKFLPITFGGKVNNLFNTYYENLAYRPMPDRNIQFYINFKF